MKIFLLINIICVMLVCACKDDRNANEVNRDAVAVNSEVYFKKLYSLFNYEEKSDKLILKKCFANICTIFEMPKAINKDEIMDFILIYQIFFSSDMEEVEDIKKLLPEKVDSILRKYSQNCREDEALSRCVFMHLAKKYRVIYKIQRFDEGQLNEEIVDYKKITEKVKYPLNDAD